MSVIFFVHTMEVNGNQNGLVRKLTEFSFMTELSL